MNKKIFWLSIVGIIASFMGGFLLANSLNRNELSNLRAENERLKNSQAESKQAGEELSLSEEEIKQRIAEADQNPTNTAFQKNLGMALYNYASMKQDADLLLEVSRLLTRVYEKSPDDYQAIVTLGNINFDVGYFNKNNEYFEKARMFYQKALDRKPDSADVRTDFGLTYYLANPPETDKAVTELEKSLKINPKHEKTLQVMVEILNSQNKIDEAEKFLARLKEVNPNNQILVNNNLPTAVTENGLQKQ